MRWIFAASAAAILVTSGIAQAEETDFAGALLQNDSLLKSPPRSCDVEHVSLNTFELQQCAAVAFRKADKALNVAFQAAIKDGDPDRNKKLIEAQRHWIALRNLECDWESSRYAGGTVAGVVMGHCLVDITRARTKEIEKAVEP